MASKAQMLVRLPADLKVLLKDRAVSNHRTATGELVAILARELTTQREVA